MLNHYPRLATCLGFVAVTFMAVGSSQAGPSLAIPDALFSGSLNNLHDQDSETIVNPALISPANPNGFIGLGTTVTGGDYLEAVFQIENINQLTGGNGTHTLNTPTYTLVTGIALLHIDSISASPIGTDPNTGTNLYAYTVSAPTSSEWTTLTGLTTVPDRTIATFFDSSTGTNPNQDSTIAGAIADASTGTQVWNFGFTGLLNGDGTGYLPNAAAGEGWRVTAANTLNDEGNVIVNGNGTTFKAGLSEITAPDAGVPITFGPASDKFGNSFNGTKPQMYLSGSLTNFNSNTQVAIGSSTEVFVAPVVAPEPVSWLVWLGLGGVGLIGRTRRRIWRAKS